MPEEWTIETPATCAEQGKETQTCTREDCNHTETREIPLDWCGECPDCIDRCNHEMTTWTVEKYATCTTSGEEKRNCNNCDHTETRPIQELNHNMSIWTTTRNPTCTQTGTEKRTCTRCTHFEENTIGMLPHNRNWLETTPRTCTTNAIESHICSDCDDISNTRTGTFADGHQWIDGEIITPASCLVNGQRKTTCTTCGIEGTNRIIQAPGHTFGPYITVPPTCTEFGYKSETCTTCNHERQFEFINETGHNFTDWEKIKDPTCMEPGSETRHCQNCDLPQTRDINPTQCGTCELCYTHDCGIHCMIHCTDENCEICNPPPPPPPTGNPNKGLDAKWIGIIIGAAILILGIMVVILLTMIHKNRKEEKTERQNV